ncbi:MAG: glycosyltransferase [Crocinitomicaceae bacterium]
MKKIKVLRIINRFNIGGPTYNATFLTAFLGPEYETLLVGGLPDEGESDSLFILENYDVKPLIIDEMVRNPSLSSDRKAYKKLKQIIKDFQPDIVHTHAAKAGALGRRAAISCKVPVVIHTFHGHIFHSYFGKIKTSIFKTIERRLAKKSDAIIAISEIQKYELSKVHRIVEEEKITVVPLGFDLVPFRDKRMSERENVRTAHKIDSETVAIAIVGRLAPIKNHSYFLDVMEAVLKLTTKKIKVFIVGDGTEKEIIETRVKEINAIHPNVVQMTSWIEDIGKFNAGMDIICLTSKNEGTPVSLIEAQAAGIPVVTTDVGGVRDIIIEGETGHVIPGDQQKLFIKKVLDLVENENKREKMSQNGWSHVEEKFHYLTLVKNMEKLYSRLLTEKMKL